MMIVLSDGAPYGGRHRGGLVPYTKKVIEHIEKSPVELIGMGLDYDGVDKYYKNSVSINGRDVERALLTVITNNILRTV